MECISNNHINYLLSAYYVPDSDLNCVRTMTYFVYTATYEEVLPPWPTHGGGVPAQRAHSSRRLSEECLRAPSRVPQERHTLHEQGENGRPSAGPGPSKLPGPRKRSAGRM